MDPREQYEHDAREWREYHERRWPGKPVRDPLSPALIADLDAETFEHPHADTPEQISRAAISAYREYIERYGQSPEEATEAAVREVTEALAVDVEAERADRAAHPGPKPAEMEGWPL